MDKLEKSIESFFILGGVPVLRRPIKRHILHSMLDLESSVYNHVRTDPFETQAILNCLPVQSLAHLQFDQQAEYPCQY